MRVYHLCVGWGSWPDEPFLELLQAQCELRNLNCLVCRGKNVRRILTGLEAGRVRVLAHLDTVADFGETDGPFTRLAYAVKDAGGFVVNEPDAAKAAENKALMHYRFQRAGILVPYTVVVRNWKPTKFGLSAVQRKKLGRPFIIKPARGYGKQGVAKIERGSINEIARARRYDRGDDFLLQKFIEAERFGHRMGWFRVFYLLGEVSVCWWDTTTQHYSCLSLEEFREYRLAPLVSISRSIAAVSGMNYFSTEVAVTGRGAKRRFPTIDYVNDPCDMTLQTYSHSGVPDRLVEHVTERLAEAVLRVSRGVAPDGEPRVWFAQ